MEAAVSGIPVLFIARGAKREIRHRRCRTIVGHGANNGKARAAVGAVDKRIAIAALTRVAHFRETRRASGGIRHDLSCHRPSRAAPDSKFRRRARPMKWLRLHFINACQRRALLQELLGKRHRIARQAHQHAFAIVADIPAQMQLIRQLPDERAKPHALHFAAHPQLYAAVTHRQNSMADDVSNAARRRFSALICSSLLRSTHTSACVGQASIHAGPVSR
ncbi:hypothetical protein D3C78_630700 [compost metagenome]